MKWGLFFVALLMLIYLLASFLGSGYIGILYFPSLMVASASGGRIPFEGAYTAAVVIYIIVMVGLFAISSRGEKE